MPSGDERPPDPRGILNPPDGDALGSTNQTFTQPSMINITPTGWRCPLRGPPCPPPPCAPGCGRAGGKQGCMGWVGIHALSRPQAGLARSCWLLAVLLTATGEPDTAPTAQAYLAKPAAHLMDMSAALTSHTALASNQTSGMSVSPYLQQTDRGARVGTGWWQRAGAQHTCRFVPLRDRRARLVWRPGHTHGRDGCPGMKCMGRASTTDDCTPG